LCRLTLRSVQVNKLLTGCNHAIERYSHVNSRFYAPTISQLEQLVRDIKKAEGAGTANEQMKGFVKRYSALSLERAGMNGLPIPLWTHNDDSESVVDDFDMGGNWQASSGSQGEPSGSGGGQGTGSPGQPSGSGASDHAGHAQQPSTSRTTNTPPLAISPMTYPPAPHP
jgi:hypothetical protein